MSDNDELQNTRAGSRTPSVAPSESASQASSQHAEDYSQPTNYQALSQRKARESRWQENDRNRPSEDWEADSAFSPEFSEASKRMQRAQRPQAQLMRRRSTGEITNSDGSRAPRLRLDLNLEAEVRLKARVHGQVTLSILPQD